MVVNSIFEIVRLTLIGFIFLSYLIYLAVIKLPFKFIFYVLKGFVWISYIVYRFIRYVILGFIFPFVIIYEIIAFVFSSIRNLYHRYQAYVERIKTARLNKKKRLEEERAKKRAILEKRKLEEKARKQRLKEEKLKKKRKRHKEMTEVYVNENVKIEKKTFGERIDEFLRKIIVFPQKVKQKIIEKYNNSSFVKNSRNKRDMEKQALLIEFATNKEERSDVKILYEYVAKDPDGKIVKGYFDAYSKVEVHSFLLSEGYEVYRIRTNKWIQFFYGRSSTNKVKIKTKKLLFFLTQLSTYLKSGIPLVDSLKILTRQYKNKAYQKIFRSMIYDLTMGDSFSEAMIKQGEAFPRLLINMIKAAEMTGQLPETLDEMAEYYTQTEKTRKQMITAMIYPTIVFVLAIAVISFILIFVIPRFVQIYESIDQTQIPKFTLMVMAASDFLENNLIWVLIGFIIFILIMRYLYNNVKLIRTLLQYIFMKTPGFGKIIIYNEITMFTKTFASLLSHNIFITDSMDVLNRITNNEIYKMLILDTISNLARGEKISKSFKDHWAFPLPAYEMLVTGERTGQLAEMMAKVADYYQELHRNAVTRLKTLIEPALLIMLTVVIGMIVLSIIIPMFNAFSLIQQ